MRNMICAIVMALSASAMVSTVIASPEEDLKAFQQYYMQRFPDTPINDFIDGVYSIDAASREIFDAIEEFPPYEIDVEKGEEMYNEPFANGSTYNDCFGKPGVRHLYPMFDSETGNIVTLESAINDCRKAAGERPLGQTTPGHGRNRRW